MWKKTKGPFVPNGINYKPSIASLTALLGIEISPPPASEHAVFTSSQYDVFVLLMPLYSMTYKGLLVQVADFSGKRIIS